MKTPASSVGRLGIVVLLGSFLVNGCVTTPVAEHNYLKRPVMVVAVIPGSNKTEHPDGTIVVDKAWEEALTKVGFKVISADRVATYAASRGISLHELQSSKPAELGRDLKVDAILQTEILEWGTSYVVIRASSTVKGKGRLVEASTGALIWEHGWTVIDSGGQNNNGIVGALINAAVTAIVNSAVDVPARLAKKAIDTSAACMPRPGMPPAGAATSSAL